MSKTLMYDKHGRAVKLRDIIRGPDGRLYQVVRTDSYQYRPWDFKATGGELPPQKAWFLDRNFEKVGLDD